ncbi:MAG: hypothetical protein ABIK45_02545 [Pseudomonadota bacterium]
MTGNIIILDGASFERGGQGPCYTFTSMGKKVSWPMDYGRNLGPGGAWNLFWRLGFTPKMVNTAPPDEDGVLIISTEGELHPQAAGSVRRWADSGKPLIMAGDPSILNLALRLDIQAQLTTPPHIYTGLAWTGLGQEPQVIAPFKWQYADFSSTAEATCHGVIAQIQGEVETPALAHLAPQTSAPAIICCDSAAYLNGNPFRAFQAWLQCQADLRPWLNWRPRLFWLDDYAAWLWRQLTAVLPVLAELPRPGIPGYEPLSIVLRHDVDSSRDTSYLEEENARGIKASYAILDDANAPHWVETIARNPQHENCFHYESSTTNELTARIRNRFSSRSTTYEPSFSRISPKGILAQVRKAHKRGIQSDTIHRHALFMLYPEHIEALDVLKKAHPAFLGGNNFFIGQYLLWGAGWPTAETSHEMGWHSVMTPYWYPFRPVHAGDKGRLLDVWEGSNVMEYEPHLVERMLEHKIDELPQRLITLNYHPFHAHNATFAEGGRLNDYKLILSMIKQRGGAFLTMREALQKANAMAKGQ